MGKKNKEFLKRDKKEKLEQKKVMQKVSLETDKKNKAAAKQNEKKEVDPAVKNNERLVRKDNVENMKTKGYKVVKAVYDKRTHTTDILMKKEK